MKENNMYKFIEKQWCPVAGECPHNPSPYCYVPKMCTWPSLKEKYTGPIRMDEKCYNNLPSIKKERMIFVGHMNDIFALGIPNTITERILLKTNQYPHNYYLFQSKNPGRFKEFIGLYPPKTILGTTIESTNNEYTCQGAPSIEDRVDAMCSPYIKKHPRMVNIEPIQQFELQKMLVYMRMIEPTFVSIGADSKGYNLIEPTIAEVKELVKILKTFTTVKIKDNLKNLRV